MASALPAVDDGDGGLFGESEDAVDAICQDLMPVTHRWMHIGVLLSINYALLEQKRDGGSQQLLRETIQLWVDSSTALNLQRLVEAVEHSAGGNNPALAKVIKNKHTI